MASWIGRCLGLLVICTACLTHVTRGASAPTCAPLPEGVQVVWDTSKAWRQTTPTRERICINGLWRWQPAEATSEQVPEGNWGYFKVPGSWPGVTDYMQKDSQTVFAHPSWAGQRLSDTTAAWYEREIAIPTDWAGRHITARIEYLNSYAAAYVDGRKVGEARFPGGEVDLTVACHPGGMHRLSLLVVAMPLKGVMLSYTDSASAREVKGSVARRGLCGDVYLVSTRPTPFITDVRVETSVRRQEVAFDAGIEGLASDGLYAFRSRVLKDGHSIRDFTSPSFRAGDLKEGRIAFTEKWMPDKLWDIHTPQNMYDLKVSLLDDKGTVLDTSWPVRFGFREFWIEGRDFFLNGTRIFLSALPVDNAQIGAALANYDATRESLERLKTLGINLVYTHNYGCQPGSHLGFAEILRAADDVGMLVSFSQPHFSHYDWQAPDANDTNGYARHAEFYVRAAQDHPSVVMYSMSHNATGYGEDMNPDMIDGIHAHRDTWAMNNVKRALRAEGIVNHLDPSRIVYHHASGNLGSMHVINFYPNFVPIQELSDWFGHWATQGVKPVFTCEYGAPFTWDWAMYRGWYKGKREFGSAVVPWEFCLAEWNAQFFGDRAFAISDMERRNLRWEAKQFREGKLWHRWDYPHQLGSTDFPEREPVFAMYYQDNWRAFRTWGVSGNSPWEHHILFKLRPGMDSNRRQACPVDWQNLQRPGFSPDYQQDRYERMDLAYDRSDWVPTEGAEALIRNNQPLLAYIAGRPAWFTSKDHNFFAGETIEKQIIINNNSRVPVSCECSWSLALPEPMSGQARATMRTGQQERMPIQFALPAELTPGQYRLSMIAAFSTGETQKDEFTIHVLPRRAIAGIEAKVAVFDPKGQTTELLKGLGVRCDVVDTRADLAEYDILIVGKGALTVDGPAPDIRRVREGLRVLLFEQTPDALEQRLGFRAAQYGLRNVFGRVPDHPALSGLQAEHLRDWRGEATILPPQLKYELSATFAYAPTVTWCGIPVSRAWRCGCQGNVASVLIEKPACGDFLPIVDGGFSLQYSPLLEYREGKGMVLFCQLDVTGRTEADPAAQILTVNLLEYVSQWKSSPRREALYAGEPAGSSHLQAAGLRLGSYDGGELRPDQVLVIGPGSSGLSRRTDRIDSFLEAGGQVLAIGLTQQQADTILPVKVSMKQGEHINAYFDPPGGDSPLAGVGPADVHSRDPRTIPLVSGGADITGDGVLAVASNANVVFCQLAPWQFDYRNNFGLKRTFRRTSFLVTRLLGNVGVSAETPLLTRFSSRVRPGDSGRWLEGFYLDKPEEWDDPYRFFRW
ncbi:MAG: hypothetical protein JW955_20115 [Sedimentisphaerales bacterium]|nr:hypothetical protein [Sedimentisphaerales bacterium]